MNYQLFTKQHMHCEDTNNDVPEQSIQLLSDNKQTETSGAKLINTLHNSNHRSGSYVAVGPMRKRIHCNNDKTTISLAGGK